MQNQTLYCNDCGEALEKKTGTCLGSSMFEDAITETSLFKCISCGSLFNYEREGSFVSQGHYKLKGLRR